MSWQTGWPLLFAATPLILKVLWQFSVAVAYFRAALHSSRIHISPVLFLDPILILGVTWVAAVTPAAGFSWPVVLVGSVALTAMSYLTWTLASRLGVRIRVRRLGQGGAT